jgi:hypothetical protein
MCITGLRALFRASEMRQKIHPDSEMKLLAAGRKQIWFVHHLLDKAEKKIFPLFPAFNPQIYRAPLIQFKFERPSITGDPGVE